MGSFALLAASQNPLLEKDDPKLIRFKAYKRSMAFQFAVEGLASWFSFHVEDWASMGVNYDKAAKLEFNYPNLGVSEYSYVLVLNRMPPQMLVNILMSFYFIASGAASAISPRESLL